MAAAAVAMHLGAAHEEAVVGRLADRALDRHVEAGPAGAALELALAHEQGLIAGRAAERAGAVLVEQRAGAGPLGPVLAHHVVLLRREERAPLGLGLGD